MVCRDVVFVGVYEPELRSSVFHLHLGLALIDWLKRRIMRDGAVAQSQPPGMSYSLSGAILLDHLGILKERLHLVLG